MRKNYGGDGSEWLVIWGIATALTLTLSAALRNDTGAEPGCEGIQTVGCIFNDVGEAVENIFDRENDPQSSLRGFAPGIK